MSENPYESPASIVIDTTVQRPNRLPHRPPSRPIGVSILSVLHFLGGFLLLAAQALMLANLEAVEESLQIIGIPPVLLILGVMFLTVLVFASAVGMWMGTKWGWWLAAFYYMYSIFRNATALYTVLSMADQLEGAHRGPGYYFAKHSIRIIIHFLLFLYFFKGNVLDFFGLEDIEKGKAVTIIVGICLTITVVLTGFSFLFA